MAKRATAQSVDVKLNQVIAILYAWTAPGTDSQRLAVGADAGAQERMAQVHKLLGGLKNGHSDPDT